MDRPVELVASSSGPSDTAALAHAIAGSLRPNDVVVLGGDLGAGKTTFTKALGAELGVQGPITSPTFTLAQRYEGGRLTLHHLDVYRIERIEEVIDLALPELFESGGVVVIEWGDKIASALPASYLLIRFGYGTANDERTMHMTAIGPGWVARIGRLRSGVTEYLFEPQVDPC